MLYFFETKNIRHKPARAQLFHAYGDAVSEHDMDFDWADETMHAGYGKHWLKELLAVRGQDPTAYDQVRERCEKLVTRLREHRHAGRNCRHQKSGSRPDRQSAKRSNVGASVLARAVERSSTIALHSQSSTSDR